MLFLKTKKYLGLYALSVAIIFFSCSSKKEARVKYRETKILMGTVVQIDVCYQPTEERQVEKACQQVWQRIEDIHHRMGSYDENSDVTKINFSYEKPSRVTVDTYDLIQDSLRFSRETKGAFDITVWPLVELWREAGETNTLPTPAKIKEVLSSVGAEHLEMLAGREVRILTPGTKIDLSGIAKGYAVDEAARIFRENGFQQFLIDAGGDIYVGGRNCENKLWRIGVRDPRDKTKIIDVLELTDSAITTSGDYEQYHEVAGKQWSHIMNPLTGYPQEKVSSATVIAPKASWADALSTALCVLDPQEGIALIEKRGEAFAGLIMTKESKNQIKTYASKQYQQMQIKK